MERMNFQQLAPRVLAPVMLALLFTLVLMHNRALGAASTPIVNAEVRFNHVELSWESTDPVIGFYLERSGDGNCTFKPLLWVNAGPANSAHYVYVDYNLSPGKYCYRIKAIDTEGNTRITQPLELTITPEDVERGKDVATHKPSIKLWTVNSQRSIVIHNLDVTRIRSIELFRTGEGRRLNIMPYTMGQKVYIPLNPINRGDYTIVIQYDDYNFVEKVVVD